MAGGVLKGFGIPLIALGILLLVAGIGAAAYSFVLQQENDDRLLADPEQEDLAEALLVYGAAGALAGIVLLVLGLVLNAAGNGRRHRELLQATAARPADAPGAAKAAAQPAAAAAPGQARSKAGGWAVAGVVLLGLLVLFVAVAALGGGSTGANGLLGDSGRQEPQDQEFDGAVQDAARMPLAGGYTTDDSRSRREFTVPDGAGHLLLTVEWTPAAQGTDELLVLLEQQGTDGWIEAGRAQGPGPLSIDASAVGGTQMRYRVFPGADGTAVLEQPFHVRLDFSS